MKPIQFKYKKLYDENPVGLYAGNGKGRIGTLIAYQLTPCGDYTGRHNLCEWISTYVSVMQSNLFYDTEDEQVRWHINKNNPTQPFLIPAEHFEQFKQAVHEYNRKYCEQPDTKVLDGFREFVCGENSAFEHQSYINDLIEIYKFNYLESEYFEEITNEQ